MSSVRALNWWVQAAQGGSTSPAYQSIKIYFENDQQLLLTDSDMNDLTGPTSKLQALITQVEEQLEAVFVDQP